MTHARWLSKHLKAIDNFPEDNGLITFGFIDDRSRLLDFLTIFARPRDHKRKTKTA